jgi:hypothetical protein
MHGAIEMGPDMQGGVDALRHDHLGLQILRIIHLVAGIADPAGRVHIHDMGEIDYFHHQIPILRIRLSLLDHIKARSARCAPAEDVTLPRYTVRCHTFAPLAATQRAGQAQHSGGNAMRVFKLKLPAQKLARVA